MPEFGSLIYYGSNVSDPIFILENVTVLHLLLSVYMLPFQLFDLLVHFGVLLLPLDMAARSSKGAGRTCPRHPHLRHCPLFILLMIHSPVLHMLA